MGARLQGALSRGPARTGDGSGEAQEKVKLFHKRESARTYRDMMFIADPHCHWCNREVVLPKHCLGMMRPYTATADHVKSRLEAKTEAEYHSFKNIVLACYECNAKRARAEHNNPFGAHKAKVLAITRIEHRQPSTTECLGPQYYHTHY